MLTKYNEITERGLKTQYKRALAAYLDTTIHTVDKWVQHEDIPAVHIEKVKEFNKEFFK